MANEQGGNEDVSDMDFTALGKITQKMEREKN